MEEEGVLNQVALEILESFLAVELEQVQQRALVHRVVQVYMEAREVVGELL
jgi:hypothetical protein